ncbi:hypothetical protein STEG23_014952, partial [Scotinomys teguina]
FLPNVHLDQFKLGGVSHCPGLGIAFTQQKEGLCKETLSQKSLTVLSPHLSLATAWKVWQTLAFSIHELAVILGDQLTAPDLVPVFSGFLKDLDEVRVGVLKLLYDFLKGNAPYKGWCSKRREHLHQLQDFVVPDSSSSSRNWRFRYELAEAEFCVPFNYNRALEPQNLPPDRSNPCFTKRSVPAASAVVSEKSVPVDQFVGHLLPSLLSLASDPVPNVRVLLAKALRQTLLEKDLSPDVFFLRVRLEETGELFRVANCRNDMTVREFKEELDLMVGIPFNLQRLHFLDQGILMDDATLKFYDVIPGAVISLCIWHYDGWTELVLAAVEGDPSKMACLGICEDTFYRTANSQHFKGEQWRQWTTQRAFVALYISAHRGHVDAVRYLLELGANCLGKSPLGRTPLHVIAAMGRTDCIRPLLEHGAYIHDKDLKGETPITIARRLKREHFERKMYLLYWKIKSGTKDLNDL